MISIYNDDCIKVLEHIEDNSIDLIATDPPFNTGKIIQYRETEYDDSLEFDTYLKFIENVLKESYRVLKPSGTMYMMLDYHSVHYIKCIADKIFGMDNFLGEVIWSYNFGGTRKDFFAQKHMTFICFAKNKGNHIFNYDAVDKEPYMAKGFVSDEKFEEGKRPVSVWWNSIVGTNSKERYIGTYATKKPLKIFERIVKASSNEGDTVLDMFAGSGTTGEASEEFNRNSIMIDKNIQAKNAMIERYDCYNYKYIIKEIQ